MRPTAQVAFNYLGCFPLPGQEDWAPASEGNLLGSLLSPDVPVPHIFQLRVHARDEPAGPLLTARWSSAGDLFTEDEIQDLAQAWTRALYLLIDASPRNLGQSAQASPRSNPI